MSTEQKARLHIILGGRVQGVGFRYYVLDKASALHLTGWVRNKHTGEVEVMVEGDRWALKNLLVSLRSGPRGAVVSEVNTEWLEPTGEYKQFAVRPSL